MVKIVTVPDDDIILAYETYKSSNKVASVLGISKSYVLKILHKYNIELSYPKSANEDEIVKLYREGYSARKLSEKFDIDHHRIIRILEKYGDAIRSKSESKKLPKVMKQCVTCGKLFLVTDRTHLNKLTCSKECRYEHVRRQEFRERHYNWNGGVASYRDIATKIGKEWKCEICGTTDGRLCVHHIDKNHKHNYNTNLMILCNSCHTKLHMQNGDIQSNENYIRVMGR